MTTAQKFNSQMILRLNKQILEKSDKHAVILKNRNDAYQVVMWNLTQA